MSVHNIPTEEVAKRTGYSVRKIQDLAVYYTRFITVFAIKVGRNGWMFDERAVATIMLVKNRIDPRGVEESKVKAIELLYGIKIV